MELTRYRWTQGLIAPDPHGTLVSFADYEALRAQVEAVNAQLMKQELDWDVARNDLLAKVNALEKKRDDLIHGLHLPQFVQVQVEQKYRSLIEQLATAQAQNLQLAQEGLKAGDTIARLTARVRQLEEALKLYREASFQSHSGHWDKTGGSGTGCPECIRANGLREQADALAKGSI